MTFKLAALADEEIAFLKELFSSNIPVTINSAHVVVSLKAKVEQAVKVIEQDTSKAETEVGKEISDHLPGLGP